MKVYGDPCPRRRPSTSTSVRLGPSPRKSAVAMPPAVVKPLVPLPRSCPNELLKFCGSWVMRSLISVLPDVSMYFDDKTCIGLVLTSFGAAMREPVTMISCRGSVDTAGGRRFRASKLGRGAAAAGNNPLFEDGQKRYTKN